MAYPIGPHTSVNGLYAICKHVSLATISLRQDVQESTIGLMKSWDIYSITAKETLIHGIKLRGRIRKFAIAQEIELLAENATDAENTVRFAIEAGSDNDGIGSFVAGLIPDASVNLDMGGVVNPTLSKLKVNIADRYEI